MNTEKVFCKDCEFFMNHFLPLKGEDDPFQCIHKENKADTWYGPRLKFIRKPQEINANNDCPWFIKKPELSETLIKQKPSLFKRIFGRA